MKSAEVKTRGIGGVQTRGRLVTFDDTKQIRAAVGSRLHFERLRCSKVGDRAKPGAYAAGPFGPDEL